jgi:hypothetical protein
MMQPAESGYDRLFELFDWSLREHVYRVRFADGEEYEMTAAMAGQDMNEPPHCTANVVRTIRSRDGKPFPESSAMFFMLPDVAEVADARTGEILYRAV